MYGGDQRSSGPAVWGSLVLATQEDIHNQRVNHGLDPRDNQRVNNKSILRDGQRLDQGLDPRVFHCPHCTYRATQRGNLQRHIRSHTGDSPFACLHCAYRTNDQSNLARHIKRKHR